jgi:hypothetical protein
VAVQTQRELVVGRQLVEAPRLREDLRDERRRHRVIHDEVEADVLERVPERARSVLPRAGHAGEIRPEVDHGNLGDDHAFLRR